MLFGTLASANAGVAVSAQVDRTHVVPGQSLQMQVKISGGSGDVDISPIDDFKVRSIGTSSSVQIINGHMSREVSYNYLLIPRGKGELTIPPLTVTVGGRPYHTDAITITVSAAPPADAGPDAPDKAVWVAGDLSETTPYIGQQITYTFRFYRSVPIDDAKFQPPGFKGFTAQEVKDRHSYRKIIDGREYVVTEIDYILTPLEAGDWTVDPTVVNVGVLRRRRSPSQFPFDDFFNRSVVEPRELQTKPLKITVRPLPPLPPGQDFSGLVGRFTMTAETESTHLAVGDSCTLTITLQGKGNITDAQHPRLVLPPAFKSYADNPQPEVTADRDGVHGKMVFRTALVPLKPGRYALDPIRLTYFDVEKETYQTLEIPLPPLTVVPGADRDSQPLTVTPGNLPPSRKKVAFTGHDILPPKGGMAAIRSRSAMAWPLFLVLLAAPASLYGLVLLAQQLRRPATSAAAVMKTRARQALKRAGADPSGDAFPTALYQALTAAIYCAAGRYGEALTWKEAETLLLEKHHSAEEAAGAAKLLAEIESIKFGGRTLPEERRKTLLEETRTLVRRLTP
jgi:hypothetical protein